MKVATKILGLNKAEVHLDNGTVVFFSYQTPVAAIHNGKLYVTSLKYSQTTTKHVSAWTSGWDGDRKYVTEQFLAKLLPTVISCDVNKTLVELLYTVRSSLLPHQNFVPNVALSKLNEALSLIEVEEQS